MGTVHAEIELTNSVDLGLARRHLIGEEEVRRIRVSLEIADQKAILIRHKRKKQAGRQGLPALLYLLNPFH